MVPSNAAPTSTEATIQAELETELRQAEEDFARGDFVDVTIEELDRCIAAGVWAMAGRVLRTSTTFRRSSAAYRAVSATMRKLGADALPGAGDYVTTFSPGAAYVRRVVGQNVWTPYRFDRDHLFILTARNQPPVPLDE